MSKPAFSPDLLKLDCDAEVSRISDVIRASLRRFRRQGIIIALSGGIDSSLTAALCVKAVGAKRVFGIHMPDKDSSDDTLDLSRSVSETFEFDSVLEEITPQLEAAGCYRRQEEAIRAVIPQYEADWRSKIALESAVFTGGFNRFKVVAESPEGVRHEARLSGAAYLGIVAATNFKQRIRKMMEYYHADRLNYVVAGTPNRQEYDQGFFVKLGDGAADIKPIAHLGKSQVYQLAEHLGVPKQICDRAPTTDTYSLPQGQDEFYFALPYREMDLCLFGMNHGYTAAEVAPHVGLEPEQVEKVYADIETKRESTAYLHAKPVLMEEIAEIHS